MFEAIMKIGVIGLGSMGKRRIRLLQKYAEEENKQFEILGVDSNLNRQIEAKEMYGIAICSSLGQCIKDKPFAVFVCTAPLSHAEIINTCLKNNIHVFTEINLVSDLYDENINLAKVNNCVLFLSSTFLYREEIAEIKKRVSSSLPKCNYSYHIGQYLPDWHPWECYENYFVGDKRTNGCREIMAIDLPWIINTFGDVKRFQVNKSKNITLNIDYNDNYIILLEHKSGAKGALLVDVVSRKAVRNFEVFSEDIYLSWNGAPDGLSYFDMEVKHEKKINLYNFVDKIDGYSSFVIENAYMNEIRAFFNQIEDGKCPLYDFERDKYTLQLIDSIEGKK